MNEKLHYNRRPLELELVRFLTPNAGEFDESELWLLDVYLWEIYSKKQSGMNPALKLGNHSPLNT